MLRGERADVTDFFLMTLVDTSVVKHNMLKWEHNEEVHQLFIEFKKAYDSVSREVLYNIPIEFGIPMQLVRVIKLWGCYTSSKFQAERLPIVGCPLPFKLEVVPPFAT